MHKPGAVSRSLFKSHSFHVITSILILSLVAPGMLFSVKADPTRKTRQSSIKRQETPNNAPPSSFTFPAAQTFDTAPTLNTASIWLLSSFGSFLSMFTAAEIDSAKPEVEINDTSDESNNELTTTAPPQPVAIVDFDFDGDGQADVGRWNDAAADFRIRKSSDGTSITYTVGASGAKIAPGDYNGDGNVDAAVFSAGTWTYKTSPGGSAQTISLGQAGDTPVPADYDGDGITDAAVFRPSNSTWYIRQSSTTNTVSVAFGSSGDVPVPGNYDGDTVADIAIFRPSTGDWWINGSTAGVFTRNWGLASDIQVPADYTGDGKTDMAVFRPSTAAWYVLTSDSAFSTYDIQVWGSYADQPVPADYDGDGKADFAIWRPATGAWHIKKSVGAGTEVYGMGIGSDKAVSSAYIQQIGANIPTYPLARQRLSPRNNTGGTDLYSQNFGWGTSIVGLPGRAGLDMGFGLSYNSLVWTKEDTTMYFDTNLDNVSPGFRLGFPVVEPAYFVPGSFMTDPYWIYVMVTPSGKRIEFKQVGMSEHFETTDSSYLQLSSKVAPNPNDPIEDITLRMRGTDGSQTEYEWIGGAYRAVKITDRNGNYISIEYGEAGQLETVIDTLGREVNVNYDNDLYPTSVTQTWKTNNGSGSNTTHTWAEFNYTTVSVNTDFDGLSVAGPPNAWTMKVLDNVEYADGSSTKFYHNSYVQVWKIENYAANNDLLSSVHNDLQAPSPEPDVPRFTTTWSKTANFNLDGGVPQAIKTEVKRTPSSSFTLPGGLTGTGTKIEVEMVGHPYEAVTKMWFGESGWQEGLPLATEDHAKPTVSETSDRQRWSWNLWTQDDVGAGYQTNPRIIETRIGDSASTRKTEIDYLLYPTTGISQYGLVSEVRTYDNDLTTVLKKQQTDYNLDSAYLNRRIIGLPSEVRLKDGSNILWSKNTFAYDEEDFEEETNQIIAPIRHDSTNYGSAFIIGRGNLTSMTRHDVLGQSSAVTTKTRYDIAGSVVAKLDPLDRKVRLEYDDAFNDTGTSRNTFAYPTKIYDPANNFSTVKYRFDVGGNVEAVSPAPAGQSYGKKTKRIFDSIGRLQRDSVYINTTEHSYVRYEYPTNGIHSKVYSTPTDTDNDGADADDEVLSESWTDGAGRVRFSRVPHTFSSGTPASWAGTVTEYDVLGRVTRQSVPTEVDNSFIPTGDDSAFLWTYQKYDWMGRVIRKINTDGVDSPTLNDSDILISYEGCGCAGQLETTVQGEEIIEKAWNGSSPVSLGRRKQKSYQDILGRVSKTQVFEWDGTTPYQTTEVDFNALDQPLTVEQTDEDAEVSQITTMTYDGHGRLKTRHVPQQDALTATTYNYNADDSISSVVDARGAATNVTYNNLGLVTQKSWTVPNESGITVPANVTYTYDSLGNRLSMTDGLGEIEYEYDPLSRMTAETRDFTDTLANAPNGGVFRLEYSYTIGGALESLKDPYNYLIEYSYDKLSRLQTVTSPTSFNGISNYASLPNYNARGQLIGLTYGNGVEMAVTSFNNKLQATGFEVMKDMTTIIDKEYQFYADGSLRAVDDGIDPTFDRLYKYDFVGRAIEEKAGTAARGESPTGPHNFDQPYSRTYQHNAFGKITAFNGYFYGSESNLSHSFTNGRNAGWTYDADGNILNDVDGAYQYDASGQMIAVTGTDLDDDETYTTTTEHHYDGDGQITKMVRNAGSTTPGELINYYIRSTILNKVISETIDDGKKLKTYIPANGTTLAEQNVFYWEVPAIEHLKFFHQDASGSGVQQTVVNGSVAVPSIRTGEYDAMGRNVATPDQYIWISPPVEEELPGVDPLGGNVGYRPGRNTYFLDGVQVNESHFMAMRDSGVSGGIFGIVEQSARFSRLLLGWRRLGEAKRVAPPGIKTPGSPMEDPKTIPNGANAYATFNTLEDEVTIYYAAVYANNWNIGSLIASFGEASEGRGWQSSNEDRLRAVFDRVEKRLKNNPDCVNFLSRAYPSGIGIMNGVSIGTKSPTGAIMPQEVAATQLADRDAAGNRLSSGKIVFNQNGFFFTGQISGISLNTFLTDTVRRSLGIGSISVDELLELIVIHELKHNDDREGVYDDASKGPNPELNMLIIDNCFNGSRRGMKEGGYGILPVNDNIY